MMRTWMGSALLVLTLLPQVAAAQKSRMQAVTDGRAQARHRWSASAININPTRCPANFDWHPSAGTQTYQQVSYHYVGDFIGLPYNWGGHMDPGQFDGLIATGYGAGATASTNLEPDGQNCTAGVDCSGFVTKVWGAGHNTTSSIPGITSSVTVAQMLAGDVWNSPGYHVAMYTQTLANGIPEAVESVGYNVNINRHGGYASVQGFVPRRYTLTGTDTGVDTQQGTTESPIVLQPNGTVSVSTAGSMQSSFSSYGCARATSEGGPEVVFQVTVDQPGTLSAAISDDTTGDLDVHILSELNTEACVARDNASATAQVGCGTYYVVVDTYGSKANAGAGDLTTTFTPSGAACGTPTGPAPFEAKGALGAECNSESWCDVNQGGEACLRTSETSGFCSAACETNADCTGMVGGDGCCGPVTVTDSDGVEREESYCYVASRCEGGQATSSGATTGSSGAGSNGGSGRPGSSGSNGSNGGDDDGDDDDVGNGNGNGTSGQAGGDDDSSADGSGSEGGCRAMPGSGGTGGLLLLGALGLIARGIRRRRA